MKGRHSIFFHNSDRFNDFEIIVVNDGRKDKTEYILRRLLRKIPNLKVIAHPKNIGYGQALISGFNIAKFSLYFLWDADGKYYIVLQPFFL